MLWTGKPLKGNTLAYKVEIHQAARKQILSFPREVQERIALVIDSLAQNPRPFGCKKLRDTELWRTRVGKYRIIYTIEDNTKLVQVLKVATRRENTYKRL